MHSVIIYNNHSGSNTERFRSPAYPVSEQSLQVSVMNGQVWLYVDRSDRRKYYFELL